MAVLRECKTVLLGQESSGKSALVERLLNDRFSDRGPAATIGLSYAAKRMPTKNGEVVISVWDTAGAEKFDSLSRLYYSGADAALICVDLTSGPSFTKSQHWVRQLKEHRPDCQCYIVLTKCDLLECPPTQLAPVRCSSPSPDVSHIAEDAHQAESDALTEQDQNGSLEPLPDTYSLQIRPPRKGRDNASPTNVLDRQGSSFGSTNSRATGTSSSSFDLPRQTKRKAVSDSQLQSLARVINAPLVYTSAATGQGVAELFQMIADDLAASQRPQPHSEEQLSTKFESRRGSSEFNRQVDTSAVIHLDDRKSCYRATRDACCS